MWGFLFGWACLLVILTGSVATVAVGFAEYFSYFLPALGTNRVLMSLAMPWGPWSISAGQLVAAASVVVITAINRALVMAETALAVIVVVGAGLLLRTVQNLAAVDVGLDRSRMVTFSITLPQSSFDIMGRVRAYQRTLEQLRAVPGVQMATAMTGLPLDRPARVNQTEITNGSAESFAGIDYQRVMTGFFETTGIPILQGRGFQSTDAASAGGVALVNETMAKPIGQGGTPSGSDCALGRIRTVRGSP